MESPKITMKLLSNAATIAEIALYGLIAYLLLK
jgi:hypothetical protein